VAEEEPPGSGRTPSYVLSRLREDSRHTVALAQVDGQIGHPGVKGCFRELLLNNLLLPWLPSAVGCGTGVIVDHQQAVVDAGQDDIILFDQLLAPSLLASPNSTHGVYCFDNVLCRVEVKSKLTNAGLNDFAKSSKAIAALKLAARPGQQPEVFGALNLIASFNTAIAEGKELEYLVEEMRGEGLDPCGGVVSGVCIAQRGFWLLGAAPDGQRAWKQLRTETADDPLAYFVGVVSNSCFDQRAARQGLKPVGGGLGLYLDHPFDVASPCA